MTTFLTFLCWCVLLVLCWPLALLAIILFPIVWLLLLPFRLLYLLLEGCVALLKTIFFLPARLLGFRCS